MGNMDKKIQNTIQEIKAELLEAVQNYPPMVSCHEGFAILNEEVDELWDEVKKKPANRHKDRLRTEAKQIAAMAARFMMDLT